MPCVEFAICWEIDEANRKILTEFLRNKSKILIAFSLEVIFLSNNIFPSEKLRFRLFRLFFCSLARILDNVGQPSFISGSSNYMEIKLISARWQKESRNFCRLIVVGGREMVLCIINETFFQHEHSWVIKFDGTRFFHRRPKCAMCNFAARLVFINIELINPSLLFLQSWKLKLLKEFFVRLCD